MAELTYDPKKVKLVDIETIIPNDWNPKDEDTEEYQKLRESIKTLGLEGTIKTRQYQGKNQVIDGMQRYKLAKEFNLKQVYIYDEGVLSDQRAREKTIWWQLQVPFNRIEEAHFVIKTIEMGEPIQLPYTEVELEEMRHITLFNFDQYKTSEDDFKNSEGVRTLSIKMMKEQYDVIIEALRKVMEQDNCTESQALERICADYLAGA